MITDPWEKLVLLGKRLSHEGEKRYFCKHPTHQEIFERKVSYLLLTLRRLANKKKSTETHVPRSIYLPLCVLREQIECVSCLMGSDNVKEDLLHIDRIGVSLSFCTNVFLDLQDSLLLEAKKHRGCVWWLCEQKCFLSLLL